MPQMKTETEVFTLSSVADPDFPLALMGGDTGPHKGCQSLTGGHFGKNVRENERIGSNWETP